MDFNWRGGFVYRVTEGATEGVTGRRFAVPAMPPKDPIAKFFQKDWRRLKNGVIIEGFGHEA